MSQNTLIIYDTADGDRIVHVESMFRGLPTIEPLEDAGIYDSTNHEYVVGVMNYDDIDFDTTTDLLTEAACTKYGVTSGEKDHYIKDRDILIPDENVRVKDMVYDTTSYELSQDELLATNRERYLKLTPGDLSETTLDTTSQYGEPIYSLPSPPTKSTIEFTIQKIDSDDSPMTGEDDDDTVWISTTGGIIKGVVNRHTSLITGTASFYIVLPNESKQITVKVETESIDKAGYPVITGTYSFLLNSDPTE